LPSGYRYEKQDFGLEELPLEPSVKSFCYKDLKI